MHKEVKVKPKNIVKKVSILGILINLFLVLIKLVIGVISKSYGLIADGIHSVEDMLSSLMSYVGARIASKPKDQKHPYGYGKAEYIFSELISLSMLIASYIMFDTSIKSIIAQVEVSFSKWLIIACLITIITKLGLYIYTKINYLKHQDILIRASMIDHRNDIFMTSGTLIGIVASYFGYHFIDGAMGCIISICIAISGFRLLISSCRVLMDTNLEEAKLQEIVQLVERYHIVLHVDYITSKPVGSKYILILKISMAKDQLLEDVHEIAGRIKAEILDEFSYISDVIVHVNPH